MYFISFIKFLDFRGCTKATITFFTFDSQQKELITLSTMYNDKPKIPTLVSCLYVSQDRSGRHLAAASYSQRLCTLTVWRIEESPEHYKRPENVHKHDLSLRVNLTEALVDGYPSKQKQNEKWVIKVYLFDIISCILYI